MRIDSHSWVIDPSWLPEMDAVAFNGNTMAEILSAAMQRLIGSFGRRLQAEANALVNANPPTAEFSFTDDNIERLLRDGEFKYNQYEDPPPFLPGVLQIVIPTPQLVIGGLRSNADARLVGLAGINENWVEIDFAQILDFVAPFPETFPQNQEGQAHLEVLIGKTILHEIIHNHGFSHPDRPMRVYNPADVYWRTFPAVCEQAYFQLNRAMFPNVRDTIMLRLMGSRDGLGPCGTVS